MTNEPLKGKGATLLEVKEGILALIYESIKHIPEIKMNIKPSTLKQIEELTKEKIYEEQEIKSAVEWLKEKSHTIEKEEPLFEDEEIVNVVTGYKTVKYLVIKEEDFNEAFEDVKE